MENDAFFVGLTLFVADFVATAFGVDGLRFSRTFKAESGGSSSSSLEMSWVGVSVGSCVLLRMVGGLSSFTPAGREAVVCADAPAGA